MNSKDENKERQYDGRQRVLDQKWKMAYASMQFTKDAERSAVNFLFIMNGSAIIGILTFLGAFHGDIQTASFIWMLCGLGTLSMGVLLAMYLCLRIMKISGYVAGRLFEHAREEQLSLSGVQSCNEEKRNEPITRIQKMAEKEVKNDIKQITAAYCLISISIGLIVNALLYLKKFTLPGLWLIGLGIGVLLAIILAVVIYRLLTNKDWDTSENK